MAFALFPGDTALLLAILVIGACTLLGMATDGLRMGMLLISSILAWIMAPLIGNWIPSVLLPANPLWREAGAGAIPAFLVMSLLFFVGGHFLHKKITFEIKDKWDDYKHDRWGNIDPLLGRICGGLLGIWFFLLIGGTAMPLGYLTAKVRSDHPSNDPLGYQLSSRLYRDFSSLGLHRPVRLLDPAEKEYYLAADIAALSYHNFGTNNLNHVNRFRRRLLGYPGLVDASYNPHIRGLTHVWTTNTFFMGLYSRTNLSQLLSNPQLYAAWRDEALKAQLAHVNLVDFKTFLEKGKSDRYNAALLQQQGRSPILGCWELDTESTFDQFKSMYPKMNDREMKLLDNYLVELADQMSLSFSDGFCYLEGRGFPRRALGVKANVERPNITPNDFLPSIPPRNFTDFPQLITYGSWEKKSDGSYLTHFKWGKAESNVTIQLFPTRIMVSFESFRGEKYVFKRQKL
tara:strand:+ start:926 stop:2302 length:1377 start_codon:yes stop_codon:yes gene_type:complete